MIVPAASIRRHAVMYEAAQRDCREGRLSRSTDRPLTCFELNSNLYLIDGYHRLCEADGDVEIYLVPALPSIALAIESSIVD